MMIYRWLKHAIFRIPACMLIKVIGVQWIHILEAK